MVKLFPLIRGKFISGMDIGTAKPSKKELPLMPHYLIDIKNPDENYTVAEYKRDVLKTIKKIIKRKRIADSCRRHRALYKIGY